MIYVAIGANLPAANGVSPLEICRRAAAELADLPVLRLAAQSRWYDSLPQPPAAQPNYVNGIVALKGTIAPDRLLAALHAIEAAAGRMRYIANAARTLDLDIIDMDGLVRPTPDPILPHPRAHLRAFVLLPLRDVAPHWVHPIQRLSIDALIGALPDQPIRVLE